MMMQCYGKNTLKVLLPALVFLTMFPHSYLKSQDKNLLLGSIAADIIKYKGKVLTLSLRLKYVDKIFEKIIFYDSKNRDITFDISSREIKEKLKKDMLNLHEGMHYLVTFKVQNVGNLGMLIAEIIKLKPVVLEKLP